MTSTWDDHQLEERIVEILHDVPLNTPAGHAFGRPFLTAYQLAIEIERRWPDTVDAIGKPVGGAGSGQHDTLSQYVANQLSQRIGRHPGDYLIEGAFMSNRDVSEFCFERANGQLLRSSSAGTTADLSMYRLRAGSD